MKWVRNKPEPLDLLKEELSCEDTYVKVNAVHRLPIVAALLGPEAVTRQLLPYLSSKI